MKKPPAAFKYFFFFTVFIICIQSRGLSQNKIPNHQDELKKGFLTIPDSIKLWVYWYWLSDNISKEGITKDLESMAKIGIGQAFIGNIGDETVPYGKVQILSEEWWKMTEHAIREGKRLGVNIGVFNCPGWSQSGGPWIEPRNAMRYLVNSEITIEGGKKITQLIKAPKDTFQDVVVIAFRAPAKESICLASLHPQINSTLASNNLSFLADGDASRECIFPGVGLNDSVSIEFTSNNFLTARSLVLYPAQVPFATDVLLEAEVNGKYISVKKFLFDRSNPILLVGPMPYSPVAVSFAEIRANKFRLTFKNIRSAEDSSIAFGFSEIAISEAPKLERFIEKQLGKMFQTPAPLWDEYQWTNQPELLDTSLEISPDSVINITNFFSKEEILNWDAPPGRWIIMRIGMTPTGTMNGPSLPHARGLEVDKMNKEHLKKHFDAYIGKLIRRMPEKERSAFNYVVMDSYEMGSQNWTDGLEKEFQSKYNYDPIPWLAVMNGRIVGSADQSNRFLWDLRRLVADKVAYEYVGGLRDLAHQYGMRVWLENYGHWGFPSEFLMYGGQSDEVAGEFWNEGTLGDIECKAASSSAHIYGKNRVTAESFTAAGLDFRRYPGVLKKRGDWSFTEGINNVLLHVFIHQPDEDKNPGINAWFSTEFNRKNTWFSQIKTWTDYERRCMFLLQQGKPVIDVCYFIGEDAPKMTGTRTPEIPKGYSYDYINAEVIEKRLNVKNGRLVLPDGMSYRILVLPPLETIRPALLMKIRELVNNGAVVLGNKPIRSPSLEDFPYADKRVHHLSNELWGNMDGHNNKVKAFGKGLILSGMNLQEALDYIHVEKDLTIAPQVPVLFVHRKKNDMDIYFITNQSDSAIEFKAGFRIKNKIPELWDAVSGDIRPLPQYDQVGSHINIPIYLEPAQSYFILFGNNSVVKKSGLNFPRAINHAIFNGVWTARFDTASGGPVNSVIMDTLNSWTESVNDSIKYYSGTVFYENDFNLKEIPKDKQILLTMQEVKSMARVKVNGINAGGVWTSPYSLDITKAVKKGKNEIEIEVTNTWANRLIGNASLPENLRSTWLSVNNFKSLDPLEKSGLLGNVMIQVINY